MSAPDPNSPSVWGHLWSRPEHTDWRGVAMDPVYKRIAQLIPPKSRVVDIGGGVGMLAECLRDEADCRVEVWEHNDTAISACRAKGIPSRGVDITKPLVDYDVTGRVIVSTEVLEHLDDASIERVLSLAKMSGQPAFFSVPNDRLTPAEEPQHTRSWTALSFKHFLERYFKDVRVEVLGKPATLDPAFFPSDRGQPLYLLGICGLPKSSQLSVCFPARDEAADIEKTLASFRGVADELVVGIDPRTKDNTREIAEKYADVVFDLTDMRGPPGEEVPEGGVHFAHIRNQCMDRCTKPWIFMTEAHETLHAGADVLLHLDQLPSYVQVALVTRMGGRAPYRQQWLFPWLCRNRADVRYKRSTHNTLDYGDLPHVILSQVRTLHERVHEKDLERQKQRKVQNRTKLMEDWLANANEFSLHYLGAEWREWDPEKAIRYLREYLVVGKSGMLRYHTRLVLAKELARLGRTKEASEVLHGATSDDWSRSEHFVFLGDLAFDEERYDEAAVFFEYAAARKEPPLTTWWVDTAMYSWMPIQRLAMAYAAMGRLDEARDQVRRLLDVYAAIDAPDAFVSEANENLTLLENAIHERDQRHFHHAAE